MNQARDSAHSSNEFSLKSPDNRYDYNYLYPQEIKICLCNSYYI